VRRVHCNRAAFLIPLLLSLALAAAQPYAADGGFDRPQRLFPDDPRPLVALSLEAGRATIVRRVGEGLVALEVGSDAERPLATTSGVRELRVAGSLTSAVVPLWTIRDPASGRYQHLTGAGSVRFETPNQASLLWLASDAEPLLLGLRVRGGLNEIILVGESIEVLHRSDLQLKGLSGSWEAGRLHLTWLEGFDELGAFGLISSWTAYAASLDADAAGPSGDRWHAVPLGEASGSVQRTVTAADAGRVVRAYTGSDGRVVRSLASAADAGDATLERSVAGRPLGAWVDATEAPLFIARGESILRWRGPDDVVPVVWSPMVVLDGAVVRDADGVTHLLWVGTDMGGDGLVYRSDDRRALERTLLDRLAATFGWRPWSWAEEAGGQLLTALLVAVLVATGSLPLVWLLGLVAAGQDAPRARLRGASVGAGLPSVVALLGLLAGLDAGELLPLFGGWVTLAVGGAAAAGVTLAVWRRRDLEPMPGFVLAAATALGLAVVGNVFIGFRAWLALGWW